jgi:MFS transporter, DHA1 family, tetracycline resistance protein
MSDRADAAQGPRTGRSPLLAVFLTVFIDLLGFGIVIPLLPIYTVAFDADEVQVGILFACFSAMQFLFAPMWGRLSDRIGRKPVLVGGLLGTAIAHVLFARAESMGDLYVARLLAGFFGANISSAQAYIADVTTERDRAKGMGLIGAAFGLGFTFGPMLGGQLSFEAPGHVLPPYPGYAAAALSLAAAMFGALVLREPERHRAGSRQFGTGQLGVAFKNARIGMLILLNFLNIFAFSCFEAMFLRFGLALFPQRFGQEKAIENATQVDMLSAARIGGTYLFAVGIISAVIQGGLIRRLVPRYGETRLASAGPAILGLSLFVIGGAPIWSVVIAGCILMPLGFGISNPSVNGLLSRAAPGDEQGAYLGMNQSAASLARAFGPPFAGWLFAIAPRLPFFAAGAVLFVACAIAVAYRRSYGTSFDAPAPQRP